MRVLGKAFWVLLLLVTLSAAAIAGMVAYKGSQCLRDPLSCVVGGKVDTNCDTYGDAQPIGATDGPQCADPNTELYAGGCYKKCSAGLHRTAVCTCSDIEITTDCGQYGDPKPLGDVDGPQCDPSQGEYYAGLCYRKCPPGYDRTAACTCKKGSIDTDCSAYGMASAIQASCPPGTELWGGLCYTDQCKQDGGNRTASCTCDFGGYQGVEFQCGGDCPPGTHRTAACSCQRGGIVTDCGRYGSSSTPSYGCPDPNTESYASACYRKCPPGKARTAACTCSDLDIRTDCGEFGSTGTPGSCKPGREFYGSTCVKACPAGYNRTAACTCQKGSTTDTSCDKFGAVGPPNQCPAGREFYGGMCYRACPSGTHRTAACSCQA